MVQFKYEGRNSTSIPVLFLSVRENRNIYHLLRSRDSVVGIATGYGLDDRGVGVRVPVGVKNFPFSTSSRSALGHTHPPIQWVPGAKRQERESDHTLPTSAKVKKMWLYTSTPLYIFMA
jgi:hypothetical protein